MFNSLPNARMFLCEIQRRGVRPRTSLYSAPSRREPSSPGWIAAMRTRS